MRNLISPDLEFIEVLNAFPCLRNKLKLENFNLKDIKEGKTIYEYFIQKSYSDYEIDLLVKKLNNDVKYFLKRGSMPEMKLQDENMILQMTCEEGEEEE